MPSNLKLNMNLKSVADGDDIVISGYANTVAEDRAGDVIIADAWKSGCENYLKNPILLFNHNYDSPIGKVTKLQPDSLGLKVEGVVSAKANPQVATLVEEEILKAFSVSFRCKDASYDSTSDIFVIKELELFEISVVSVPCNQDSLFSVAKSFESNEEYNNFKKQFAKETPTPVKTEKRGTLASKEEKLDMTPEEMKELMKQVAAETAKSLADAEADRAQGEQEKSEKAESFKAEVKTAAESLLEDVETRFREKNESLESVVEELKTELHDKSAEIQAIRTSKHSFGSESSDWRKEFADDLADIYVLGLSTGKGWETNAAKSLLEKVNANSSISVSSADFEQVVSTNIERDIQNELVLAPLFRELPMTSATMIMPILPDAGYAEFNAGNPTAPAPNGNLDARGVAYGTKDGIDLQERTVSTKKLTSVSYLSDDTEEDANLPILPLLRESMVRSHARAVENAILLGNHADGAFGTSGASFNGLVKMAADASQTTQPSGSYAATDVITAADLLKLRRNMGKYGIRPEDVIFIVSQDGYFDLLEDAEFQDTNTVGSLATKVKGEIGSVYGSKVVVCDEYLAKAAGKFNAVAVNTRNFLIPRLRGMKIDTGKETVNQRRVLVASQRLGFIDVIPAASAKWALQYKAS